MNNLSQRPALGQLASIGTFFNERTDSFLPSSLLKEELPHDVIAKSPAALEEKLKVELSYIDTYEQKFDILGIEPEIRGSILAGIVSPGAAGRYLDEVRENCNDLHAAIYHKIVSCEEKLNFMSSNLQGCLTSTAIQPGEATHVVTGIKWGAQSVVTARISVPVNTNKSNIEAQFHEDMEAFKAAIERPQTGKNGASKTKIKSNLRLEITAYGDILLNDGISMANLQEGYNFLDLISVQVKNVNNGMGYAIAYTLLPVSMLSLFLPVQIGKVISTGSVSTDCLKKFVQLFDSFRASRQELHDYHLLVAKQVRYLPPEHVKAVESNARDLRIAEESLKAKFAKGLQDVRTLSADPDTLWQLLREFSSGTLSPKSFMAIKGEHQEKVHFIEYMVANGAVYIGYNGLSIQAELSRKGAIDSYIFRFSKAAMAERQSWKANWDLLQQLLKERQKGTLLAIVDCDASTTELEKAHILHYHNGQQTTSDLFAQRSFFADKCLARYQKQRLDTKDPKKKPLKRRFVKIACPGSHCDPTVLCDWLCSVCLAPIEYGYTDDYLYCDCGRALFKHYDFKCKNDNHGPGYEIYDTDQLLSNLRKLKQSNYLNILILGETGVGKSTFINAFVNYLTFETLDEAMKEEKLTWVIPCSFDAMDMDRSKPGSKIKRTKIAVGSRPDEADGSRGASATQQTTVYPVTIGTTTIRLIDTPGIGDTRGLEYDRKNMADIIATLGSYDDLHGVLILLKSNMARLTPTFSFCVKELLRNLHRDAARNMAFGFTNTRISNYTPGDTLGPLETLLEEHPDVGLSTSTNAMYCFDSESFRYLAAYKNGFIMPNEEDFRRSWQHSKEEADRLIQHFQSRKPHVIKSTTSLHGTRELISMLAIPMADISQTIRTNISLCEDHVQELRSTRATGEELRKKLRVEKIYLEMEELGHHRTVCRDKACFEVRRGDNEDYFIIYKTPCHAHCYLDDIIPDTLNQPGLISCYAFGGRHTCNACQHSWEMHMHVIKETIEKKVFVNDGRVEKKLADHADDVQAKQQAIKDLRQRVEEYKAEHDQIRQAAAQFSNFLRREAIALYNDKTQAYIEFLINEEEAKVHAGKSNKKLLDLQEDLKKYLEEVAILEKNVGTHANYPALTTNDIDRLVRNLYGLKHFGKNLEALKKKNVRIYEAQNREVNHRVRSNTSWGWNTVQNIFGAVAQTTYSREPSQLVVQQSFSATSSTPIQHGPPAYQEYPGNSMPQYSQQYQEDPMGTSIDPYSQQHYHTPPARIYSPHVPYSGNSSSSSSSRRVLGIPIPTFKRWERK